MGESFRGSRRRIGVLTLLMALLFVAAWAQSFVTIHRLTLHVDDFVFNRLVSSDGGIASQRVVPVENQKEINTATIPPDIFKRHAENAADDVLAILMSHDDKSEWRYRCYGWEFDERPHEAPPGSSSDVVQVTTCKLSYWWLIIPLILASLFLLIIKPRKPTQQKITDSNTIENH